MRITNNMLTNNFLKGLNTSLQKQSKLQEQLSDGKLIHRASDDPIKAMQVLTYSSNLSSSEQYLENAKNATSWMNTTDTNLTNMTDSLIRIKELVTSADGTEGENGFNAIAEEIDNLINELISVGNTQIGDRYLFAGQKDKTEPFTRKTITTNTGETMEIVQYNGDDNKISIALKNGIANPQQDSINVTNKDLFKETMITDSSGNNITTASGLNDLLKIKNELQKSSPDIEWIKNNAIDMVDNLSESISLSQTIIGTRVSAYERMNNIITNNISTITGNLATVEDIELDKVITDYKNSQNTYNAALSTASKILPKSLVDYLG